MRDYRKKVKGFTLVEIMIVVAIIGLLAAIGVPGYMQSRVSARTGTCLNNLRIIYHAKSEAALDLNLDDADEPTTTQISPYLKFADATTGLPLEPLNGTYSINVVSVQPTCSVGSPHEILD